MATRSPLMLIMMFWAFSLTASEAGESCQNSGPQAPRDISNKSGSNSRVFPLAPVHSSLNLCNIHFHSNAEHRGPGFKLFAGKGDDGDFKCNDTDTLTAAQRETPHHGACHGLKAGDTIEVHWVHTSCAITPGKGLGSCLSDSCTDPLLRVEAQAFLVVNDRSALDFANFDYSGNAVDGLHRAKALPSGTGDPVVFRGSTTGPSYNEQTCSPLKATWSVRPTCARVDINSLNAWCAKNAFGEEHAHGVRQLVTTPEFLAKIE